MIDSRQIEHDKLIELVYLYTVSENAEKQGKQMQVFTHNMFGDLLLIALHHSFLVTS